MSEELKALARRMFEEMWNEGNLDAADELLDASYVAHGLGVELPPGPEGFKQFLGFYFTAFPDLHMTIEDEVAEGDMVVQRCAVTGTHQGDLMGVPPTGKKITMAFISIVRYSNGKSVEGWALADLLGMMQQLGLAPSQ